MMNQMRTNVGVLAVVALLGFGGCGGAEVAQVSPAAEDITGKFKFRFTCLAGGATGCDFKLFFRTPDKFGDFAEGTAEQPNSAHLDRAWEITLNKNQVCDTPITSAPGAMGTPTKLKIDGHEADFARGLMVAVGDRTGHYYGSEWVAENPPCYDAFLVSVNGLTVPTVSIEGMLPPPTSKPFSNCLISEVYFRGSTGNSLCNPL